jgi:hypothetical protein
MAEERDGGRRQKAEGRKQRAGCCHSELVEERRQKAEGRFLTEQRRWQLAGS